MRATPSLLTPTARGVALIALIFPLIISCGCITKTAKTYKGSHSYPSPHVVGATEVMQKDAAAARTRELVRAGKTPSDARRIAEREFPPIVDSGESTESAEYYRWQQQQVSQTKFEGELDKMKRSP